MNKTLIELQKNCPATAIVIKDEDLQQLQNAVIMPAKIHDSRLLFGSNGKPIFKDKLDEMSQLDGIVFLVIEHIDEVCEKEQNKFVPLVKDREMSGYVLPKNTIIVFTTNSNLKNISPELFHFCIVA
jgi:hypothetical protein